MKTNLGTDVSKILTNSGAEAKKIYDNEGNVIYSAVAPELRHIQVGDDLTGMAGRKIYFTFSDYMLDENPEEEVSSSKYPITCGTKKIEQDNYYSTGNCYIYADGTTVYAFESGEVQVKLTEILKSMGTVTAIDTTCRAYNCIWIEAED